MRTLKLVLIVIVLTVVTAIAQDIPTARSYEDADAYEIYSLLLPNYESHASVKDPLMILENTVAAVLSVEGCVSPADAHRFRGAIVGYYRIYEKHLLLQRRFQLVEPYRVVGTKVISTPPDHPYFSVSPVGFNRARTQAIVWVEETCGGLCGSFRFHFLEKVSGKWKEKAVATCAGAS